jgi:hypothetical protein
MSSSPTAPTSTTSSSTSSHSPAEPDQVASGEAPFAVIACGAIATHVSDVCTQRGWAVDVHPLPPLLHNHPEKIAGEVEALALVLRERYGDRMAVGYADCGTYGALDEVCARQGLARLGGAHCYDVFAGQREMAAMFEADAGTYVLTDFLVRSFRRSVIVELGLDRYPQLRDDYFGHYQRVVWLAQQPTPALTVLAEAAAASIGLPLEIVRTGYVGLERELAKLLGRTVPAGLPAH